jgi:hypothetical protein
MRRQAVFGILLAVILCAVLPLAPRVVAANALVNGDFETGTFEGWTVISDCYIGSSIVHAGSYSACVSDQSWDSGITQVVYGSERLTVGDGIVLDGWIYPTKTGYLGDYPYPYSLIFVRFYDESTQQQAFMIAYEWSATSLHKSYPWIKFVNMEANTWNHMVLDVAADVRSTFQNVTDFGNISLYSIEILYHWSIVDPGSFFADDLQVYGGTSPFRNQILIDPSILSTVSNENFSIDIETQSITDLYGWELQLYYLNSIINCTGSVEGNFLKGGGNTVWAAINDPNYNATHGMIDIGASLVGAIPGVSGSGILASVHFEAKNPGNTSIEITNAIILDSNLGDIICTITSGLVEVREPTIHDIAVLTVSPNKNLVGQGLTMNVTLVIQNQGDFFEDFIVTATANSSMIGMRIVQNLRPGGNLTFSFIWNTTGVSMGDYIIGGNATVLPNETDIADNSVISGTVVHVGVPGDVNGDRATNMRDITALCRAFNTVLGGPRYIAGYDLTNDGTINMRDINAAILNFGKHE